MRIDIPSLTSVHTKQVGFMDQKKQIVPLPERNHLISCLKLKEKTPLTVPFVILPLKLKNIFY